MDGTTAEMLPIFVAAIAAGGAAGWLIRGIFSDRRRAKDADAWQTRFDSVVRQKNRLTAEVASYANRLQEQEAAVNQRNAAVSRLQTELQSSQEREKRLNKDVFTLRGEREDFKKKVGSFQHALMSVKQQAEELQGEFVKSREFYKGELRKAFEKRKALEEKLDNARQEHDSYSNLLLSSRSEQEAVNKMLASAQARLGTLDDLERNVIRLEAENAQLNHDYRLAQQEIEILKRDVAELEELKVQNRELAHCLESMESSRRQHETDARRYRERAQETEKKSETLRVRLDEVEKNFAEIETQQRKALREARKASLSPQPVQAAVPREIDNLQEIVGIGKVFEKVLHDLGIYSFRQIAAFGPADIARVNQAMKDSRGRMEQDDWIGQAKELLFKKYGAAEAC